jgi:hypothetical protein
LVPTHDGQAGLEPYRRAYPTFRFSPSPDPDLAEYYDPETGDHRLMLMPAVPLSPRLREQLANEKQKFFVKTHHYPFGEFLPGEMAIQIVRHPAGAIASYWRFLNAKSPVPMRQVIEGSVRYGSWSAYHEAWRNAPVQRLVLLYEDLHKDEAREANRLREFLELEESVTKVDFLDEERARNPARYPDGTVDSWARSLSVTEQREIWRLHGGVARVFGYEPSMGKP